MKWVCQDDLSPSHHSSSQSVRHTVLTRVLYNNASCTFFKETPTSNQDSSSLLVASSSSSLLSPSCLLLYLQQKGNWGPYTLREQIHRCSCKGHKTYAAASLVYLSLSFAACVKYFCSKYPQFSMTKYKVRPNPGKSHGSLGQTNLLIFIGDILPHCTKFLSSLCYSIFWVSLLDLATLVVAEKDIRARRLLRGVRVLLGLWSLGLLGWRPSSLFGLPWRHLEDRT